ncbi:unnamed protein product [Effrenium voratum]|nr:unnamed protein product [Effrenium voratum]
MELTAEELARFDGEASTEIYVSFNGKVYDVSNRKDLYGKSAPYHMLAGHECARALSTMSMDHVDLGRRDIEDISQLIAKLEKQLTAAEVRQAVEKSFADWQRHFEDRYAAVGVCKSSGYARPAAKQGSAAHPVFHRLEPVAQDDFAESPLELLSRKPRAYVQHKFLSPSECQTLISMILQRKERSNFQTKLRAPLEVEDVRWTQEQRDLILKIETRLAELTGCPIHPDETALVGTLTPPERSQARHGLSDHLGLHVDTNAAHWRFCTAIIYLSSLNPELQGGETVFPAALDPSQEGPPGEEEERVIEAAGELLDLDLDHTDKALALPDQPEVTEAVAARAASAARDLLKAADSGATGLQVKPQQGAMCLFWTRQDDGEVDRFSWHGGAPVRFLQAGAAPCSESSTFGWKWTLQKFKEVPVETRSDAAKLASFVRSTRRRIASLEGIA